VLLWTAIGLITIVYTFRDNKVLSLSTEDSHIAAWYLINGFFFNSMMDVFAGQFAAWTTMTPRYHELEPRYAMGGYTGAVVFLTSLQELLLQTPCGLALFYAYWRGSNWRLGVEVIFNCYSVAGVWYFYLSEAWLGFPTVHAPITNGSFDTSKAFTFEMIYKFWIGFVFFPALWAGVGIYLGQRACRQITQLADLGHKRR